MGGFAAALPYVATAAQAAGPLITGRGADPTAALTSQPPQPGQNRIPQGMAVNNQQPPDQTMQILFALMQQLASMNPGMQNPASPMQQAVNNAPAPQMQQTTPQQQLLQFLPKLGG